MYIIIRKYKIFYLGKSAWCYDNKAYSDKYGKNEITNLDYKTTFYYGPYTRVMNMNPSLKCEGIKFSKYRDNLSNMYVGTLTIDEIAFAGQKCNVIGYKKIIIIY